MDKIYTYAKKVMVWTPDRISKLAQSNRCNRIRRYPETKEFGVLEAIAIKNRSTK